MTNYHRQERSDAAWPPIGIVIMGALAWLPVIALALVLAR